MLITKRDVAVREPVDPAVPPASAVRNRLSRPARAFIVALLPVKRRGLVVALVSWAVACGEVARENAATRGEGGDDSASTEAGKAGTPPPPSCEAGGAGMTNCSPSGSESCCTSLKVTGGTYFRSYDDVTFKDKSFPATVSDFRLDKFEITVGRFRQFVSAVVEGWRPTAGSGKHTHLNSGNGLIATNGGYETGWNSADWNSLLATTSDVWTTELDLDCNVGPGTWTASAGSNENLPITCMTWQEAYAFCIWDGGFLPSEAEWNYAAAGGGGTSGQRVYPWSSPSTSTTIDCLYANNVGCPADAANNVGSESPKGDGAYGQSDLAGNVLEWNLDWYDNYVNLCKDCANLTDPELVSESGPSRIIRGSGYYNGTAADGLASDRGASPPAFRIVDNGARCARAP